MGIDWSFISQLEGGRRLTGYVPAAAFSQSGVTVATGCDLGQRSRAEIDALNIPESLKAKLRPYADLKTAAAEAMLRQQPLTLTAAEAEALDEAVKQPIVDALETRYDAAVSSSPGRLTFARLPHPAQTVIASVAFQYGANLPARTPRFWRAVTAQDWAEAVRELRNFGDAYPTRRRREANLLNTVAMV
ncbi:MAG: peptidase [Rhodospirillales bacterium]|nr:MAG: peptidase [Rhodospirillales bacterium]